VTGFSLTRLVRRGWMPIVAVIVVVGAAFGVYRLHGIFGSQTNSGSAAGPANQIVPFNPKHVELEVFGEPGTVATINYLDVNAQLQQVIDAPLPWTYSATTTLPGVFANLVAQGDSSSLGCRIRIDGVVKDERSVNTSNAYIYCLDKSG